jgi:hypothetical protein
MSSTDLAGKAVLEDIIDSCHKWLPEWVSEYSRKGNDVEKRREYENADDFVQGVTIGMIYAHFQNWFVTINRRELNPVEKKEVMTKILMRTPQIKKALFEIETTGTRNGTRVE